MDISDQATRREEEFTAAALAVRKPAIKPVGVCHSCGEDVGETKLFCDGDCRDDWQRIKSANERNGHAAY